MKDDFFTIADDLERRSERLRNENNPRNLGNDEIVYAISKLIRANGVANVQSVKLEASNYRLQQIMVILTLVTTFVIIFPILQVFFKWMISVTPPISSILKFEAISLGNLINVLSGIVSVIVLYGTYKYFQYKLNLNEKISLSDSFSATITKDVSEK